MSYKLVGEDAKLFHVEHPEKGRFTVPKQGLSQATLAKIKAMRPKNFDEGGDVPAYRQDGAAPDLMAMLNGSYSDTGRAASSPAERIDSLAAAPVRAGIAQAQQGNWGAIPGAMWDQFGADPQARPAPTGEDLVKTAGVHNPYLAKALGFGMDVATDPVTWAGGALGELGSGLAGEVVDASKRFPKKLAGGDASIETELKNRYADYPKFLEDVEKAKGHAKPYLTKADTGSDHPIIVPNFRYEAGDVIGHPGIQHNSNPMTDHMDPLSWLDTKFQITKNALKDAKKPVTVNTSSDLIARDDYIDALPKGSTVNMHMLSGDDNLNRLMFTGNPSQKRLELAADKLKEAGIKVNKIYPTPEEYLKRANANNLGKEPALSFGDVSDAGSRIERQLGMKEPEILQMLREPGRMKPAMRSIPGGLKEAKGGEIPGYSVTHEDERQFHVTHPDGRTFTVPKAGLSPATLKKIGAMKVQHFDDGGLAADGADIASQTGQLASDLWNKGTYTAPDPDWKSQIDQRAEDNWKSGAYRPEWVKANFGAMPYGDAMKALAAKQIVQERQEQAEADERARAEAASPQTRAAGQTDAMNENLRALGLAPVSNAYQPPAAPGAPAQAPVGGQGQAQSSGAQDPYAALMSQSNPYDDLLKQAKGALGAQSAVAAKVGAMQQKALEEYQNAAEWHQSNYDRQLRETDAENAQLTKDVKDGAIDPNRLFGHQDTGPKIATAIALILGGAAGKGNGNVVVDIMNKQIDRDIEAQKANLSSKQTLLKTNMDKYHNIYQADIATRAQMLAALQGQLMAAQAKYAGQTAGASAEAALLPLQMQKAQYQAELAKLGATQKLMADPNVPPAVKIHYGVDAKQQEAAYKMLDTADELTKARDNALEAFDRVNAARSMAFKTGHPLQAVSGAESRQMEEPMAILAKDATGRFNPEEAARLRAQFEPSSLDQPEGVITRRNAMLDAFQRKMNFNQLKGLGIPIPQGRYDDAGRLRIPVMPPVPLKGGR